MGIGGSKIEEKPVKSTTTDTRVSTELSIANKEEFLDWHVNIQTLLDKAIEQHNNATANAAKAGPQSPNKQKKKKKKKKGQDTEKVEEALEPSEPPSRIDDGIRALSIQYSLAPKEANQIKRSIALTTKLERITYKNHFGGPGVGYREEIASRVLLAVGKWFGESTSVTSIDLSNNNIGGSTRGIDKRTGDVLCPVYDIRKVGPNGSYVIQGLADSKLKRYELQYGSHETKEKKAPRQVNKVKPMGRIVLRHNNVTHYGYYYRKVGVALRNLFSNPGRIISLDLSHCSIGCDAMAKGFSNGCCGIEKINLTNNQLGGRWRHDGKWESSVSFVKELNKILLNEQTHSKYRGMFPPLRSINLSSNRLNRTHGIVLAKGLSENNTLKNINFSHNNKLCDDGVEAIVNSQYSTQSILEMLDLRETGMTNMSIFALKKLHSKLEKKIQPAAKKGEVVGGEEEEEEGERGEEGEREEERKERDDQGEESSKNDPANKDGKNAKVVRPRNLVIDVSVNNVNTKSLPASHGDSKVRFITNSWRHLVNGRVNVASLSQIQNYAIDHVIAGAKFERTYRKTGRLGLQLISSSSCPEVVEQLASTVVSATIRGSPSQPKKGTRIAVGSLLTHINGISTAGMTMAQTIERLKSVRSTVRRKVAWEETKEPKENTATGGRKRKKKKKYSKKVEKEMKEEEERRLKEEKDNDPFHDCVILRFLGKLSKGPPRLKRRKPGSRKREAKEQEDNKQKEQKERDDAAAKKAQHKRDQDVLNGKIPAALPQFTLDESVEEMKDGWVEAYDEWGTAYYWNMNTNDTSWEKPLKTFKTSRVVDAHTELDALLRDTGNATRVSILDLSNLSGEKTKDERELEKMLEAKEEEERAKEIFAKMKNESAAAHAVSINTRTRGKRQSVKHYH